MRVARKMSWEWISLWRSDHWLLYGPAAPFRCNAGAVHASPKGEANNVGLVCRLTAIVGLLRDRLPSTHVLLAAVLPRGARASDKYAWPNKYSKVLPLRLLPAFAILADCALCRYFCSLPLRQIGFFRITLAVTTTHVQGSTAVHAGHRLHQRSHGDGGCRRGKRDLRLLQ